MITRALLTAVALVAIFASTALAQYGLGRDNAMCFQYLEYIVCVGGVVDGRPTQAVSILQTNVPVPGSPVTLKNFKLPVALAGSQFAAVSRGVLYVCAGCNTMPIGDARSDNAVYAAPLSAAIRDIDAFVMLTIKGLPALPVTVGTIVALPSKPILLLFYCDFASVDHMYSLALDRGGNEWHDNLLPTDALYFGTGSLGVTFKPAVAIDDETVFIVFQGVSNGLPYFGKLQLSFEGPSGSGSGSDSGIGMLWPWSTGDGVPISCNSQIITFRQFQIMPYLTTMILVQFNQSGNAYLAAINASHSFTTCTANPLGEAFLIDYAGAIATTVTGDIYIFSGQINRKEPVAMQSLPTVTVSPLRDIARQTRIVVQVAATINEPGSLVRLSPDQSCISDVEGATPQPGVTGSVTFDVTAPTRFVYVCASYGTCAATGGAVSATNECSQHASPSGCLAEERGCCWGDTTSLCFSSAQGGLSAGMRSWYYLAHFRVVTTTVTVSRTRTKSGTQTLTRSRTVTVSSTATRRHHTRTRTRTPSRTDDRTVSYTLTPSETWGTGTKTVNKTKTHRHTHSISWNLTDTMSLSRTRTVNRTHTKRATDSRTFSVTYTRTQPPTKTKSRTMNRTRTHNYTLSSSLTVPSSESRTWTASDTISNSVDRTQSSTETVTKKKKKKVKTHTKTFKPGSTPAPPPATTYAPKTAAPTSSARPATQHPATVAPALTPAPSSTPTSEPTSNRGKSSSKVPLIVGLVSAFVMAGLAGVAGILYRRRRARAGFTAVSINDVPPQQRDSDASTMSPAEALAFATAPEPASPFSVVRELYSTDLTSVYLATRKTPKYRLLAAGLHGPLTSTGPGRRPDSVSAGPGLEMVVLKVITCVTPNDKQRALEEFALLQQVGLRTKGITAPIDLFFNEANVVHGLPCVSWRGGRSTTSSISAATENIDVLHVVSSMAAPLMEGGQRGPQGRTGSLLSFTPHPGNTPATLAPPRPAFRAGNSIGQRSDDGAAAPLIDPTETASSGRVTPNNGPDEMQLDRITLVLEYYPEGDLEAFSQRFRTARRQVPELTLLRIVEQLANTFVVMHVHSRPPIVHCNVQPANVMLKHMATRRYQPVSALAGSNINTPIRQYDAPPPPAQRTSSTVNASFMSMTAITQGPQVVSTAALSRDSAPRNTAATDDNGALGPNDLGERSAHLGDFGSARRLGAGLADGLFFDRKYAAPECFHASRLVSPAIDLWALGTTVVEVAIGIPNGWLLGHDAAHQGEATFLPRVSQLMRQLRDAGYSERFVSLVESMLRVKPEGRVAATVVRDTCATLIRELAGESR